MDVQSTRAVDTDERIAGYVWSGERDPFWLRFTLDSRRAVLTGICYTPCGGGIPTALPFQMKFNTEEFARRACEEMAILALAEIADVSVVRPTTSARVAQSLSDTLDAWNAFLENDASEDFSEVLSERRIRLTEDQWARIAGTPEISESDGKITPSRRRSRFRRGRELSGFEALKAVRSGRDKLPFTPGTPGGLDLERAKQALASVARPSARAVEFYGCAPEEKAKLRLQAAQAYPILAGMIAESGTLAKAVDAMEPIQGILTERLGLNKTALKRVGKLRAEPPADPVFDPEEQAEGEDALGVNRQRRFTVTSNLTVDQALSHLADLPPDRVPASDEEWLAFHQILSSCALPMANAFGTETRDVLEASKGNWVAYRDALARSADFSPAAFDRRAMALTMIDGIQAVEHFARTVVLPQALSSIEEMDQELPPVSREIIAAAMTVSRDIMVGKAKNPAAHIFETARRYASRITTMTQIEDGLQENPVYSRGDILAAKYGVDAFPVLCEPFHASNGIMVRPLRNGAELREEGKRLDHCIGGYTSRARGLNCHLFTFRSERGEILSSMETGPLGGETARMAAANLRLVQHRGELNKRPSDAESEAREEFLTALRSGAHPIYFDEMQEWKQHVVASKTGHKSITTSWSSVLEFDWQNTQARTEIWSAWRDVVSSRCMKADNPGAIYMEKSAQNLVGLMSPKTAVLLMEAARASKRDAAEREDAAPAP